MKYKKEPVSASVGIKVVPPKEFSVSGETDVQPTVVEEKVEDELLVYMYKRLEEIEARRQELIETIEVYKAKKGCGGCSKK